MVDHNNYYFDWKWRINWFMFDGFNIDTIGSINQIFKLFK